MDAWQKEALRKVERFPQEAMEVRERAKEDLYFFARLVNPGYMYGEVHKEIFYWLQDYTLFGRGETLTSNKLVMLPRAHLKSHIVATWCAWVVTRHPEITILYLSATASLAETQLYAIKNILCSGPYSRFFPEYIHPQEGKREKWSVSAISVDHYQRKSEGIRDATIATAGLTTNTTGWHADVIVADDLVVPENAYTEDGRESVSKKASQFTSIRNAGGFTLACGTRYHPADVYYTWRNQKYEIYNDDGDKIDEAPVWEIYERAVEKDNIFLWPRVVREEDGKAFGFDNKVLARIRGEYSDTVQYYAQYYNNPNDSGSNRVTRDSFKYLNPRLLKKVNGRWTYSGRRLTIFAAVDFAFSLSRKADYSAIVVIGMDSKENIYVLDIDRFKTDRISEYFDHIKTLHSKWRFDKLRAEVTVAQQVLVNDIKRSFAQEGIPIKIEEYRPSRKEGTKEERIAAALEHRYDSGLIYHTEGGWTGVLEEEVLLARPAHDDLKDALASAITIAKPPISIWDDGDEDEDRPQRFERRTRFGGIRRG